MKSQKTRLLLVVLGLFIATSSLMIVFATSELNIKSDLANAVQHIEKIIFRENMESEEVEEVTFTNKKNFARINTTGYNVVINNNSDNENKINSLNTEGNTILGGEGNTITSDSKHNVIIAGKNNRIEESSWAVIGGGINNTIKGESHRSVIAGGSGNVVTGRYSSIPGGENNSISGDYSVAMGVNNVVIGDASAALGSGSKIEANNSFLWTDRSHNDVLETDNTFAIVSNKGLVVNGKLPHSYAMLTIGGSGSLVIREGTEVACDANTKGVMKAVENGDSTCLCSCNGTSWTSLNGGTVCGNACDPLGTSNPKCGNVTKICGDEGGHYVYSGTCVIGKVIDGTGAYFLDKKGKVHRSCQNENGTVTQCEKEPTNDGCDIGARNHCDFSTIVENHIFRTCNTGFVSDNIIEGQLFDNNQLDYVCGPGGVLCAKVCDAGYGPATEDGMQGCVEKACESREISGYIFPEAPAGGDSVATKEGTTADGSYSCNGKVRCEFGEFVDFSETCSYMCNAGEYSGYYLENNFVGNASQTGSKSYVGSNGLTYNCTAKFTCNKGVVEMSDEVCGTGGWCPATTYTGEKIGVVNVGPNENGFGSQYVKTFPGLNGSCTFDYSCNNGEWNFGVENCVFYCTPTTKPNGGVYGLSRFDNPYYTPTTWTYVNTSDLKACEYKCDGQHNWSGGECVSPDPECTHSENIPVHGHKNNNPEKTPSENTEYYYSEGNEACTFSCDDGSNWNGSDCIKCPDGQDWDDTLKMCVNVGGLDPCSTTIRWHCNDGTAVNTGNCLMGLCVWQCEKNGVNISDGDFAKDWKIINDGQKWCGLCEDGKPIDTENDVNGGCNKECTNLDVVGVKTEVPEGGSVYPGIMTQDGECSIDAVRFYSFNSSSLVIGKFGNFAAPYTNLIPHNILSSYFPLELFTGGGLMRGEVQLGSRVNSGYVYGTKYQYCLYPDLYVSASECNLEFGFEKNRYFYPFNELPRTIVEVYYVNGEGSDYKQLNFTVGTSPNTKYTVNMPTNIVNNLGSYKFKYKYRGCNSYSQGEPVLSITEGSLKKSSAKRTPFGKCYDYPNDDGLYLFKENNIQYIGNVPNTLRKKSNGQQACNASETICILSVGDYIVGNDTSTQNIITQLNNDYRNEIIYRRGTTNNRRGYKFEITNSGRGAPIAKVTAVYPMQGLFQGECNCFNSQPRCGEALKSCIVGEMLSYNESNFSWTCSAAGKIVNCCGDAFIDKCHSEGKNKISLVDCSCYRENSPCYWNGMTIQHGDSVTAYKKRAGVYYNGGCQSEIRTCNDGILSGTYEYTSCREIEYGPH